MSSQEIQKMPFRGIQESVPTQKRFKQFSTKTFKHFGGTCGMMLGEMLHACY
jgi:hypothetical protein